MKPIHKVFIFNGIVAALTLAAISQTIPIPPGATSITFNIPTTSPTPPATLPTQPVTPPVTQPSPPVVVTPPTTAPTSQPAVADNTNGWLPRFAVDGDGHPDLAGKLILDSSGLPVSPTWPTLDSTTFATTAIKARACDSGGINPELMPGWGVSYGDGSPEVAMPGTPHYHTAAWVDANGTMHPASSTTISAAVSSTKTGWIKVWFDGLISTTSAGFTNMTMQPTVGTHCGVEVIGGLGQWYDSSKNNGILPIAYITPKSQINIPSPNHIWFDGFETDGTGADGVMVATVVMTAPGPSNAEIYFQNWHSKNHQNVFQFQFSVYNGSTYTNPAYQFPTIMLYNCDMEGGWGARDQLYMAGVRDVWVVKCKFKDYDAGIVSLGQPPRNGDDTVWNVYINPTAYTNDAIGVNIPATVPEPCNRFIGDYIGPSLDGLKVVGGAIVAKCTFENPAYGLMIAMYNQWVFGNAVEGAGPVFDAHMAATNGTTTQPAGTPGISQSLGYTGTQTNMKGNERGLWFNPVCAQYLEVSGNVVYAKNWPTPDYFWWCDIQPGDQNTQDPAVNGKMDCIGNYVAWGQGSFNSPQQIPCLPNVDLTRGGTETINYVGSAPNYLWGVTGVGGVIGTLPSVVNPSFTLGSFMGATDSFTADQSMPWNFDSSTISPEALAAFTVKN